MIELKKFKFHLIAVGLIAGLIIFTYWDLPKTFFQQDEWQGFSRNIYALGKGMTGVIGSFIPTDPMFHFNPLSVAFSWLEYFYYQINFLFYALQSIILHILNAILLYFFIFSWLKNKKIAVISALFFGTNSISNQAVTWVAASSSYEIPLVFTLLSLIFFQKRKILLSLSMLFISLLFHETGIFLFIFYPVILSLNKSSDGKRLFRKLMYSMVIFISALIFIRVPFFLGVSNALPELTDIAHPSITVFPYRLASITMKSFAGNFFPEKMLINISETVVRLAYPQFLTTDKVPNPYISQSIVFDLTSYMLSAIIISLALLFIVKAKKERNIAEALIWSMIFIPMSILPYAFVFGKAGYASILEPKFFYISSVGVSVLIGVIVFSLTQNKKLLKIPVYGLFGLFILSHIYIVRSYVSNLAEISTQRKMFLTEIKSDHSNLPKKVIFFTGSDTPYYGMPVEEKILPVQIGFGKMLMIWYQKDQQFPVCLYENQFLIKLLEQGYRECSGRGFGYFRDYEKLLSSVRANNIKPEEIIAYSWNGFSQTFIDISPEIREKIKKRF